MRTAGDFIREVIDKIGLPRKTIAKRIGVHPVTLNKWVVNMQFPELEKLQELLDLLPGSIRVGDCFRLPTERDEIRKIVREEFEALMKPRSPEVANPPPRQKLKG